MKDNGIAALAIILLLLPACLGGEDNDGSGSVTANDVVDSGVQRDVPADVATETNQPVDAATDTLECGPCAGGEACLLVTITRAVDDSYQPWNVWPPDADGVGILIVSAVRESATLARETVPNADFVSAESSETVSLCVTPGAVEVRAFLDDDGDAAADATYSADFLDSCLGTNDECFRCVDVTAVAGEALSVTAELVGSCD